MATASTSAPASPDTPSAALTESVGPSFFVSFHKSISEAARLEQSQALADKLGCALPTRHHKSGPFTRYIFTPPREITVGELHKLFPEQVQQKLMGFLPFHEDFKPKDPKTVPGAMMPKPKLRRNTLKRQRNEQ